MKTAFFVVESPMQLITAIEAKHYFNPPKSILFVRYNMEERNDAQVDKIMQYADFDSFYSIKIKACKQIAYLKILYVYVLILYFRPESIFIGDYKANFMKMIYRFFGKKKCIFLDDGAQSSYIYDMDKEANMFSYFKFKHDETSNRIYIHNSFKYFRKLLTNENRCILGNVVYFIGAPLVEKNMISLQQFNYYFSCVVRYFQNRGVAIHYLPHRHEHLAKMRKFPEVKIIVLEEPIELYLLHAHEMPSSIASFYSAALYTIQMLFSGYIKNIVSFYLPPSVMDISNDSKQKVERVYNTLCEIMEVNCNYIKSNGNS